MGLPSDRDLFDELRDVAARENAQQILVVMVEEDTMQVILKKIDIEKVFLGKAIEMRKAANSDNASVISKLDSAVHSSRRNLEYYEEMLRQVQVRRLGQNVDNMSLGSGGPGSLSPGAMRPQSADLRNEVGVPPTPPPKDMSTWGENTTLNSQNFPSNSYAQPGLTSPSSYSPAETALVKTRPNYTKLGKMLTTLAQAPRTTQ